MNRREFTSRVAALLREKGSRKRMIAPKHTFHISDDDGNKKDFTVRKSMKGVLYNRDDVDAIIDACIKIIQEAMMHGEPVEFRGFAKLGLHYHKLGNRTNPGTGEKLNIAGRYLPKFTALMDLKKYAAIYQRSLEDGTLMPLPPLAGGRGAASDGDQDAIEEDIDQDPDDEADVPVDEDGD